MKEQNFKNHAHYVPLYHGLTAFFIIAGLITAVVRFVHAYQAESGRTVAALLVLLFIIAGLFFWFIRFFPLKAQDRTIRAEENLRYFSITGKLFDKRITMGQIIALRFAENDELISLAEKAVNENLSPADIKQAITKWKADHHRV